MIYIVKDNKGMALVICLLIMAVAAMLAVGIATDSTIDGQISRNQRDMTKNFFIADGSNQLEFPRISAKFPDDLPVTDITTPATLIEDSTDKTVPGLPTSMTNPPTYKAHIRYHFYRPKLSAGYSFNMFNAYYFSTKTRTRRQNLDKAGVRTVQSKIGPKI